MTKCVCPPWADGESSALTGRRIHFHSVTHWSLVTVIMTIIINTVLHVRSRVHMAMTLSKRPCLVTNDTTVLSGFVQFLLEIWAGLARCPFADWWTTWREGHLPVWHPWEGMATFILFLVQHLCLWDTFHKYTYLFKFYLKIENHTKRGLLISKSSGAECLWALQVFRGTVNERHLVLLPHSVGKFDSFYWLGSFTLEQ